jgi:hypothetical protein
MHASGEFFAPRRRKAMLGVHCIEGETVTLEDIARRIGTESMRIARNRLTRARRCAGKQPVTWQHILGESNA